MNKIRTALITGAATGIGRAAATLFAADGWRVAVHYHKSENAAKTLCAKIAQTGGRALAVHADLCDMAQIRAMAATVKQTFGRIDALVNNAGTAQQKLFTDISPHDWDAMFAVNTDAVFHVCQAVLPDMIANKQGSIVNVSSVWGSNGASCEAHYSAAKAAVIGLTKALAKELGPCGIRVNCIAPGVIDTAMLDDLSAADKHALAAQTPLGRLGTPDDVALAIHFLASESAAFVTGQVLGVDGGFGI